MENLEALLKGNFPVQIQELFQGGDGLFPAPQEINLVYSCPDWAILCKHVAAALYRVCVRLDENPILFFELRGIDIERFIDVTIANKVKLMLENERKRQTEYCQTEILTDCLVFCKCCMMSSQISTYLEENKSNHS